MKVTRLLLRLTAITLLAAATLHAAPPTGDQILNSVDRTRNGWDSFVVDVKINNFKNGRSVDENLYQVSIKGTDRTLVKFMSPDERGKSLLMLDEAMWLYLPTASRPVRVTPLQRLSGNASNGDIAQTSLAANYTARLAGEANVGGREAWKLELTAKRNSATYQGVDLWVAKSDFTPIQAEFRLQSGKPMKRVEYLEYDTVGTQKLIRRQVMYDLLRNQESTVVEYSRYERRALADKLFNQNSMR